MACTSGCWTEQKGSPCLKGLLNVKELSQANLNSGFLMFEFSLQKASGRCFSSFITASCSHPWTRHCSCGAWKRRGRGKGRNEDGKGSGRFCKTRSVLRLCCSSSWTWLCPSDPKQPKWHHPWKHFPQNSLFCNSRVLLIGLHEINSSAHFAPSCAETTPELGCSALQELWAPLDAHKLQHWLELLDGTQLELNPRIVLCQSILFISSPSPKFPLPALQHQW